MHAVLELNHEKASKCSCILIQFPENLDEMEKTAKGSSKKVIQNAIELLDNKNLPRNISEISKERIRLIGAKYGNEWGCDIGYRVLKIDSSNLADVYYTPDATRQDQLDLFTHNIKPDRTPEDLLFQVLLDWGVDLSLPIRKETLRGKTVFFVDENALIACFDDDVNEELVKELAGLKPLRAVFRDSGFASDAVKINVEQIFKQISPGTEVRTI